MLFDSLDLTSIKDLESRSISAENPDGKKGAGGRYRSSLGFGRKGRPAISLNAGDSVTIGEINEPGCIRHIWMTCLGSPSFLRGVIIRIYWDGTSHPSVECPIGDFFGVAHGRRVPYTSLMTSMTEGRGLNSWIPMPFEKARVIITNESPESNILFYQIDYTIGDIVTAKGRFCCTFRRENPTRPQHDFTILERVEGAGRFLGCVVGVRALTDGWWGEGEVKFYIDGDNQFPTICGTGTEDYILTGWGMESHSNLFQGCPLRTKDLTSFYRWHILDPIFFQKDLRVTIQQIGANKQMKMVERKDDWSAAAFFYLQKVKKLPAIPTYSDRIRDINEKRDGEKLLSPRPL